MKKHSVVAATSEEKGTNLTEGLERSVGLRVPAAKM